jgi:16S rRNA (cytosine1402-N4)-methyltransferase
MHDTGIEQVDGVVFDLGVSSPQLNEAARGFSFSSSGPLDMRMSGSGGRTAADLVNHLSEAQLADLIFYNGEERFARRIARGIVRAREQAPLLTTVDLVEVIRRTVPAAYRHGRIHFATRTFQALRIAVNRELDVLGEVLPQAVEVLRPGGRLAVISFHSLEDRIVKHAFRDWARGTPALVRILTKKPVEPLTEECVRNPRARSAKLRVAERLS